MNASDWIQMGQTADSNLIGAFGILVTLLSGYLVVAYLVGEKLTRAQVTIVNAVYIGSALSVMVGHTTYGYESTFARYHAHLAEPVIATVNPTMLTLVPASLALVNISLIVSSLYFMWSIRHPKIE